MPGSLDQTPVLHPSQKGIHGAIAQLKALSDFALSWRDAIMLDYIKPDEACGLALS